MDTERSPITHRTVWALAGPMILSNLTVPLVGAVDTAVVGHLPGHHHIGAVAIGALIFTFLYWGFGFLRMGITGYAARAYGADDTYQMSIILLRFLSLGMIIGLILIALGSPLVGIALYFVDSTARVEGLAAEYSLIRIWSAPATLCVYVFTGIFVGLHDTRLALLLQFMLNFTNIVLDLLFVPVLQWGVPGVAWATLIAEYSAALLGFFLLRRRLLHALHTAACRDLVELGALAQLMQTNGNIFIRTVCLMFSFAFFTAQSARHGELILAVNTILLHLQTTMAYGVDGFSHAIEALGGSAYGAGDACRFRRAVRLTFAWSLATAIVFAVLYLLFGNGIVGWFTDSEEIILTSRQYLLWMVVSPVVSFASFQLDGLFIGVGHAREMRNAMLVSTAGYLVLALILQTWFGNHGLFLALTCFMVLRAVTLGWYYPGVVRAVSGGRRA